MFRSFKQKKNAKSLLCKVILWKINPMEWHNDVYICEQYLLPVPMGLLLCADIQNSQNSTYLVMIIV